MLKVYTYACIYGGLIAKVLQAATNTNIRTMNILNNDDLPETYE